MKLTITIDLDNDAFDPPGPEVIAILRTIISDIKPVPNEPFDWTGSLLDSNGNTVGAATIAEGESEPIAALRDCIDLIDNSYTATHFFQRGDQAQYQSVLRRARPILR